MTSSHAAVWWHSTRWAAFEATRALGSAADDDISTHRRAVYNGSDLGDPLETTDYQVIGHFVDVTPRDSLLSST